MRRLNHPAAAACPKLTFVMCVWCGAVDLGFFDDVMIPSYLLSTPSE